MTRDKKAREEARRLAREAFAHFRGKPPTPGTLGDRSCGDLAERFLAALVAAEARGEARGVERAAKILDEAATEFGTDWQRPMCCAASTEGAVQACAETLHNLSRSLTPTPKPGETT